MTTLLAFFIVLCSMAEDQTGMNLYVGTGSFLKTIQAGGLPVSHSEIKSDKLIHHKDTSPLYSLGDDGEQDDPQKGRHGPDEAPNDVPSKDREKEAFQRFLTEMNRIADMDQEETFRGETTFDFFEPLSPKPPHLPSNYGQIMAQVVPLLRQPTHHVELVVWAPTPFESARKRTTLQASQIVEALIQEAGLRDNEARRFIGTGRTWPYRKVKRPILSLVVRRTNDS